MYAIKTTHDVPFNILTLSLTLDMLIISLNFNISRFSQETFAKPVCPSRALTFA